MSELSIRAAGAAAGHLRLASGDVDAGWGRSAGRGTVAVCAPDEDVLTLSWDAASAALHHAGLPPDAIDGLWWGTSRPPFAEGPSHALLAHAVGVAATAEGALLTGSPHAGVDALVAASHALRAGVVEQALVIASDAIVPGPGSGFETRAGAAAVALLVTAPGADPATARRVATTSRPHLDRYRGDREDTTRDHYDARLFREQVLLPAIEEMAGAVREAAGDPDTWALPDPDGRMGRAAARAARAHDVASDVIGPALGDTGAAAPLLGLLPALAAGGHAGLVAWGGGRASAFSVDVSAAVPGADVGPLLAAGRSCTYAEALRSRGLLEPASEPVPMGVPPGSAMFVRETGDLLQLTGARCVDCGTIATPPAIHPSCPGCGGPKSEVVALARTGRVHTFVVNHTMPPPFQAPLPLVVVDLDDGARLAIQGVGDGTDLAVDAPVELVLRRYAVERGVPVYGYKARAVDRGMS